VGSVVTRARFGVIAAFAVVALAAAGCGSSSGGGGGTSGSQTISTNAKLSNGGTFNFPLYANPVSITPLQGQESEGVSVEKNVFEGLVDYNPQTLETVPDIAKSWTHNSNNTVFTFQLRNNAVFANGEKINADTFVKDWGIACAKYTASVVAYILEPIKGYDQCVASNAGVLSGVQATGPYTLQVTLSAPFSDFVETLGHPVTWAFPPNLANSKAKQANFEKHPVGSGPFSFVSWTPNKQIIIKKSTNYTGPTPAHLDEVDFHIYPDGDQNGPFLAFKSGKMQYAQIPTGQVKATEADPKVGKDVRTGPQLALYYYGFNLNTSSIIAKSLKLRQALNYATNSAAVVNNINEGIGKVADGLVPNGMPCYEPNQSPYHFDVAKAKQLLSQVGTVPQLTLGYNTDPGHQRIAEALIQGYKQVGLNVKAENFDWGTYLDKLQKGEFSFWRLGWIADYPSIDDFLYPMFYSKEAGNNNLTFYKNPKVDSDLLAARAESDPTKRCQMYNAIQKEILADAPEIPIYYYGYARVVSPQVENFAYDAMGVPHFAIMGIDPSKPAT
jgi:ABC-type transport system substrate-binding protein